MMSAGTCTVRALAEMVEGELRGRGDAVVTGVNALQDAGPDDLTFIADELHAAMWRDCKAAAALVTRGIEVDAGQSPQWPHSPDHAQRALIYVADAELAVIKALAHFQSPDVLPEIGIHPSAYVHPDAMIGADVRIGPHVSVDRGATIGCGAVLHAGVRIYAHAAVGDGSVLHANCVIRERCTLGRNVILHQNVSIGADGFGYRPSPDGIGLLKVPHLGNVVIEEDVEIGANSCVDRAKFGSTVIGAGTKIDNLVQIGHNCRIGRCCVIAGLTGLGGSVTVGHGVQIGGLAGVADHMTIGNGARIGAGTGVTRSIPAGETHLGFPNEIAFQTLRQWAGIRKLPELIRRLTRTGQNADGDTEDATGGDGA